MTLMPTIFVSHGPPSIAAANYPVSRFLHRLGTQMPRPKAILCVSAHWEAAWPVVSGTTKPVTIHDFGGPPPLFDLSYPCPGSPNLSKEVSDRISAVGMKVTVDSQRGLDHGAWVPLFLMYPDANIAVVQLSIQTDLTPAHHFELGQLLAPLRQKGILIMGSGGATHNLAEIGDYELDAQPPRYVSEFDKWLRQSIQKGVTDDLLNYKRTAPAADRNHPFPAEHFLPLFVPLGSAGAGKSGQMLHEGFMYGLLSMAAYVWE